jgi:hypothetical protein
MHRLTADRKGKPVSGLVHTAAKVTRQQAPRALKKTAEKELAN